MTRRLLLLAFVSSLGACTLEWIKFSPPDGAFEVLMPVKPSMKPSHAGTMYVAVVGNITYNTGITYVPEAFKDLSTVERMFDEMQKSLIGSEKPPRESKSVSLEFQGKTYPGRELSFERSNAAGAILVTGRVYRVNNALYTLTVYAPVAEAGPNVRKYVESFKLLKPPSAS
jgi:hypothetical protein